MTRRGDERAATCEKIKGRTLRVCKKLDGTLPKARKGGIEKKEEIGRRKLKLMIGEENEEE